MKLVEVIYSDDASGYLKGLDRAIAIRIFKKIEFFTSSGYPLKNAKQLSGKLQGLYRYRVGDYRVIFDLDEQGKVVILQILTIDHRKDVYR
jgi:mRNA interferase RelE/StbE